MCIKIEWFAGKKCLYPYIAYIYIYIYIKYVIIIIIINDKNSRYNNNN